MPSQSYLQNALAFSSKRRILFIRMYQKMCSDIGYRQISEKLLVLALEHIHASATIVDDMLDNEYVRKDIPSYYVRHGYPVAAFAALNLMVKGISFAIREVEDTNGVIEILQEMIESEEADVGLCKRDAQRPLDWYKNRVSKKISGELLLILHLCSQGSSESTQLPDLKEITCKLGQFIQYCDDWYDVLVRDALGQVAENDAWVLTYSLPLAIYLEGSNDPLESLVGVKVEREIAYDILRKLRTEINRNRVNEFIEGEYQSLMRSLQLSELPGWNELAEITRTVRTEEYWERKYYEIA